MTELEKHLYEALRALDDYVTSLGRYAGKEVLERQSRRALQAFRSKRREEEILGVVPMAPMTGGLDGSRRPGGE